MKKGQNIVKMGEQINQALEEFKKELPSEVNMFRITDQSEVVGDSVNNFLKELLIAIVAVVIVVMLLLPMRVALVAASTIPITISYHSVCSMFWSRTEYCNAGSTYRDTGNDCRQLHRYHR